MANADTLRQPDAAYPALGGRPAVTVTNLIDDRPITSLQVLVFVLCSLAAFLDGADSQSIGVAAPLIAAGFGMPMGSFAPESRWACWVRRLER